MFKLLFMFLSALAITASIWLFMLLSMVLLFVRYGYSFKVSLKKSIYYLFHFGNFLK